MAWNLHASTAGRGLRGRLARRAGAVERRPAQRPVRVTRWCRGPCRLEAAASATAIGRCGVPGPGGGFSPQCTLTATGRCPLVDQADAVVSALDLRGRRAARRSRGRSIRRCAETPRSWSWPGSGSAAQWSAELPACRRASPARSVRRSWSGRSQRARGVQPSGRRPPPSDGPGVAERGLGADQAGWSCERRLERERAAELGQRSLQAGALAPGRRRGRVRSGGRAIGRAG